MILEFFVNYIIPILELIMSVIGVIFLFKPSTPSVSIDIGTKYYFTQSIRESTNVNNFSNQSDYSPAVLAALIFFGTYLFYSVAGRLMIFIIMLISLIKVLRYNYLGIDYKFELISPILSIFAFHALNFLPNNVKEFWETNTKIDFNKFSGLQSTLESISAPFPEFLNLFTGFENNKIRNVSIFATLTMTLLVLLIEGTSIFRKKVNLKVSSKSSVVSYSLFLLLLLGYAFYHIEKNPVRIVTEFIIKWFNS